MLGEISLKPNGKLDWDIFASPTSIMDWDTPNATNHQVGPDVPQ